MSIAKVVSGKIGCQMPACRKTHEKITPGSESEVISGFPDDVECFNEVFHDGRVSSFFSGPVADNESAVTSLDESAGFGKTFAHRTDNLVCSAGDNHGKTFRMGAGVVKKAGQTVMIRVVDRSFFAIGSNQV
jgi:hypothetical protein